MNEAETCAELIDPVLRAARWGVVADSGVRRASYSQIVQVLLETRCKPIESLVLQNVDEA